MNVNGSPTIFVSYKSEDVEVVRPVCERLLAEGYSPWFNEYGVPYDRVDDFQRFINRAVDESVWGLLFANDRYTLSPYCNIEVERLLRRLPPERLFVFRSHEPSIFEDVYPELCNRQFVVHDAAGIYALLASSGVITAPIEPRSVAQTPGVVPWLHKDVGAQFDPQPWQVEITSVMIHSSRPQWLDVTGEQRSDYHVFLARIDDQDVRLWVDYRMIEDVFRQAIEQRTSESEEGKLRYLEDDEDDRRRLKDELRYFAREVETIQSTIISQTPDVRGTPEFEPIGVHMFNTIEGSGASQNRYKHRLFSFRQNDHIYRVYKLVLPQPQLGVPVALRFVFEFGNDLRSFFATLPLCDRLARSVSWVNLATKPRMSPTDLRDAMRRIRGTP